MVSYKHFIPHIGKFPGTHISLHCRLPRWLANVAHYEIGDLSGALRRSG